MLKEVLKILEDDARTTSKQIATMSGTSPAEIVKLIKQAEEDRIVLKYKAIINWDKVEDEQVWALIEVRVTPEPDTGFDSVAERVAQFPQVSSVYLASGTYDLLLVVVGKNEHTIADFVAQHLSHVECVQGTVTHFVLKRYKVDGEILDGGKEVKRQPVIL
ncbi:Lrp/AsnC family transcriptional regulator [Chloroflexota bacterium]